VLEGTEQWKIGRRNEILVLGFITGYGFTLLDVNSSVRGHAPLLHSAAISTISPDHMAMRRGSVWLEVKAKSRVFNWRGGGPNQDADRLLPAGPAHGIDRRHWCAYCDVQRLTRVPVVLVVLSITEGELRAATLLRLGEPYPSVNATYDLVNWPLSKFALLFTFDRKRLWRYFYDRNGLARDPPARVPSPQMMAQLIEWLKPCQHEFEWFRQDLIDRQEDDWS
jgi:hypothetical protein